MVLGDSWGRVISPQKEVMTHLLRTTVIDTHMSIANSSLIVQQKEFKQGYPINKCVCNNQICKIKKRKSDSRHLCPQIQHKKTKTPKRLSTKFLHTLETSSDKHVSTIFIQENYRQSIEIIFIQIKNLSSRKDTFGRQREQVTEQTPSTKHVQERNYSYKNIQNLKIRKLPHWRLDKRQYGNPTPKDMLMKNKHMKRDPISDISFKSADSHPLLWSKVKDWQKKPNNNNYKNKQTKKLTGQGVEQQKLSSTVKQCAVE